jgi:hypothetical protein
MAQRVDAPRPATDDAADAEPWAPVAIEHYNNSLVPWVSVAGKAGREWLKRRTRPSDDPGLVLVAPEVYRIWKPHATGAGGPFPKEILKRRDARGEATTAPGDTPGWRATLVLGALLIVTVLFIVLVLSLPH